MTSKKELREQIATLRVRIEADIASSEDHLAFAYAIIAELREDRAWLRGVADDRAERIRVLEVQLDAARLQIEALRLSGKIGKKRLAKIAFGLLAGVASVAELSGWTLRDLAASPGEPLAELVAVVEPSDLIVLGLNRSEGAPVSMATSPGTAVLRLAAGSRSFHFAVEWSNTTNRDVKVVVWDSDRNPRREGVLIRAAANRKSRPQVVLSGHGGTVEAIYYGERNLLAAVDWAE